MKKSVILGLVLFCILSINAAKAQSRKYVSQFNNIPGYFNPALTGLEGSTIRGVVRNQWAGWDGAPRTYFISGDLDFAEIKNGADAALVGKNAVGFNLLTDQYGAFRETEMIANYASRIRISENTSMRLGAGLNFSNFRLDGNSLSTEQMNDPIVNQYLGSFASMSMVDFNLGMAITHRKYYLSYALQNLNKGSISSGDVFISERPRVSILQAGYRTSVTENLSVTTNFMYRSQADLPGNFELNFKSLLMNKLWLGGGYRFDYAYNFQLGVMFPKLIFGYTYEMPITKSFLLPNTTHEFMAIFPIFSKFEKGEGRSALFW